MTVHQRRDGIPGVKLACQRPATVYIAIVKTVSVSEAKSNLGQLLDEVLGGHPVIVERGNRQVLLKPIEPVEVATEEAEFKTAFPAAPREPRGTVERVRRVIRRVRRAA